MLVNWILCFLFACSSVTYTLLSLSASTTFRGRRGRSWTHNTTRRNITATPAFSLASSPLPIRPAETSSPTLTQLHVCPIITGLYRTEWMAPSTLLSDIGQLLQPIPITFFGHCGNYLKTSSVVFCYCRLRLFSLSFEHFRFFLPCFLLDIAKVDGHVSVVGLSFFLPKLDFLPPLPSVVGLSLSSVKRWTVFVLVAFFRCVVLEAFFSLPLKFMDLA